MLFRRGRASNVAGMSLIEVIVAISLAAVLGTMLLSMTIATQAQARAYEKRTDSVRENTRFDSAFQAAWLSLEQIRRIGSSDVAASGERDQMLFDYLDKNGDCAAFQILVDNGSPDPASEKIFDYVTYQSGMYKKGGDTIAGCGLTGLEGATVDWKPTKWQPRPGHFTFLDNTENDITDQTATGWDAANNDQPVNGQIAQIKYTRLRLEDATNTITTAYPNPNSSGKDGTSGGGATGGVMCGSELVPNTDWAPIPGYPHFEDLTYTDFVPIQAQYRVWYGSLQFRGKGENGSNGHGQLPPEHWPNREQKYHPPYPYHPEPPNFTVHADGRFINKRYTLDGSVPLGCGGPVPNTDWAPIPGYPHFEDLTYTDFVPIQAQYRVFRGNLQFKGQGENGSNGHGQLPPEHWPNREREYHPPLSYHPEPPNFTVHSDGRFVNKRGVLNGSVPLGCDDFC